MVMEEVQGAHHQEAQEEEGQMGHLEVQKFQVGLEEEDPKQELVVEVQVAQEEEEREAALEQAPAEVLEQVLAPAVVEQAGAQVDHQNSLVSTSSSRLHRNYQST